MTVDLLKNDCACYDLDERVQLAHGLTQLKICEMELEQKQRLIDTRLSTFDHRTTTQWWQEPTVIVSGMVVSFSVASLLTFWAVSK